ncbi:MAG: YceG family protein [Paraclostridium sordellii]
MVIEDVVNNFMTDSTNNISIYSDHENSMKFQAYIGLEDESLLDWNLYLLNQTLEDKEDIVIFDRGILNTNDFDLIEKSKSIYNEVQNIGFSNSSVILVDDINLNQKLKNSLDKLLSMIDSDINRTKTNFVVKFLCWIDTYLHNLKKEYLSSNYKCFFYGDIKKHELYFIALLLLSGFDVLYINPNRESNIKLILNLNIEGISEDKFKEFDMSSSELSLEERISKGKEVDKHVVRKTTTETAQYSKKVEDELLNGTGMILNAWQVQNRELKPVVLNTTLDEIEIYLNEPLSLRPGYKLSEKRIDAPVFFSEIIGINENEKDYIKFINSLRQASNSVFIEYKGCNSVFIESEFTSKDFGLSYLIKNDSIDKDEFINNNKYSLSFLATNIQEKLLDTLEDVFKCNWFENPISNSDKVKALHFIINLKRNILLLLENFDYGKVNPKINIYVNDLVKMSTELAVALLVFNKLGIDIFIISPVGTNDIERKISRQLIDIHKLDMVVENFELTDKLVSEKVDIKEQVNIIGKKVFGFIDKIVKS